MKRLARLKVCATWTPVLLALACGGSSDNGPSTFGFPTSGSGGAGAGSSSGTGTGTGTGAGPGTSQPGPGTVVEPGRGNITEVTPVTDTSPTAACNSTVDAGKTDLDIFIMMDKSMTMTENTASGRTKWVDINNAVKQFTVDPSSAGIGVGIGFFAIFLTHSPCPESGCISCNIADYARPVVQIGLLNGNAPAIGSAIDNVLLEGGNPGGETPTRVALAGAIQYAQSYAKDHPARRVVVALATDGLPNVCDSSLDSVLQVAKNGLNGTPSIKTYVLGILAASNAATADQRGNRNRDDLAGDELPNLNKMAQAGGTGSVFLIDTTGTATGQFVRAMNSIRDANDVGCQFDIPTAPSGQRLNLAQASVSYVNTALPWRSLSTGCSTGDGFYYDNNAFPTTIRLCPATCEKVKADPAAKINIVVGCPSATGSGGTGGAFIPGDDGQGGHGGEPDATATCFLDGQVCEDSTECCSGSCSPVTGTCGAPVN